MKVTLPPRLDRRRRRTQSSKGAKGGVKVARVVVVAVEETK